MNKIMIACIAFGFVLSSCRNNTTLQFMALNESIVNSNTLISNENTDLCGKLDNKLTDPMTLYRAKYGNQKLRK